MKKQFFSGNDVRSYTASKSEEMKREIHAMSDEQITMCDIDEWVNYCVSKYTIDPITLYEDNIGQTIEEVSIKRYGGFRSFRSYEPEYYLVDGYSISFKIPFDGDAILLDLQPSTQILWTFEVSSFSRPRNDDLGFFTIELEFTKEELKAHVEDMNSFVSNQFLSKFNNYKKMIGYMNDDVAQYNNRIRTIALEELQSRRQKAVDFSFISQALQIPIQKRKDAPNTVPIPLKRIRRNPPVQPPTKHLPPEYSISEDDYTNIINIIHSTCSSMEITSRTFIKHDEEELRDFILATLGTHYENSVTGETFRKAGKTDILISFDNKAAFVGECKIWHGIKPFADAINQLFGYSTWKDTKTALIVFNKHNKDFNAIRRNVESWIKDNTKRYALINGNTWECIIHRDDKNTDVKVAIALYDISS